MAVCLSDFNIPCEEWQPDNEEWEQQPETSTPAQQEPCTPTADASGTWTPLTENGENYMEPVSQANVDEIPTYAQGWGAVVAMPGDTPGYYVPCMVTPIGPPAPFGAPMMMPQQPFMMPALPQVPVSHEADASGDEIQPKGDQYPDGQTAPPQVAVDGQPQILWCVPAPMHPGSPTNADGSPVTFTMADGTPVMSVESPSEGMSDQWGFLHEFQQPSMDADGRVDGGMYFDPSMFPDGSIILDEQGNPIWTMIDGSQCGQSRLSHLHVPKATDLRGKFEEGTDEKPVTTIMIRNIPNRYTRKMLMDELDSLGFEGSYDFIYVPMDKSTHWNVGYAFVNFIMPESASLCMEKLTEYRFRRFRRSSGKVAQVSPAHIQGLNNNMEHYSHTAVQSARIQSHRPLVVRPRPCQGNNQANPQSDDETGPWTRDKGGCETGHWTRDKGGCNEWDQAPIWDKSRWGPKTGEGWHAQHRLSQYPAARVGRRLRWSHAA